MAADPDKVLAVVEAVIFYHADPESGNNKFAGTKERVRIGIKTSHQNLNAFTRYVTSFCGIKAECVKRGLGESFEVRICRLVKDSTSQPKAFSINTHFNQPSKRLTKTSTLISILALPLKWKTYMLLVILRMNFLQFSTLLAIWETLYTKVSKGLRAGQPTISHIPPPIIQFPTILFH